MLDNLPPPFIVIGMHRSGTSLLTRVLEPYGVFWGRDRDEYNEALCFQTLNERLFAEAGARWDRPEPLERKLAEPSFFHKGVDLIRAGADRLAGDFLPLAGDFLPLAGSGFPRVWGWKDPRTTFTLPLWLRLFPRARVVHIRRHGVDVALSLYRRETSRPEGPLHPHWSPRCQTLDGCFSLWKEYLGRALSFSGEAVHTLRYEDLLIDTRVETERICRHLGLDPASPASAAAPRILRDKADPDRHRRDPLVMEFARRAAEDPFLRSLDPP